MAQQGSTSGSTARINSILTQLKAGNAALDYRSTSVLYCAELPAVCEALLPVFELGNLSGAKFELDEAMVYLRETRLCELLLSLIKRWPWYETRLNINRGASTRSDLTLLPKLLCALSAFLRVAARVRRSKRAAAYAETSKRCLSCWEPGSQSDHRGCSAVTLFLRLQIQGAAGL